MSHSEKTTPSTTTGEEHPKDDALKGWPRPSGGRLHVAAKYFVLFCFCNGQL